MQGLFPLVAVYDLQRLQVAVQHTNRPLWHLEVNEVYTFLALIPSLQAS